MYPFDRAQEALEYDNASYVKPFYSNRSDDPCSVMMQMVPSVRADRIVKKLGEEGWDDGPGASQAFTVQEGEVLQIGFKASRD